MICNLSVHFSAFVFCLTEPKYMCLISFVTSLCCSVNNIMFGSAIFFLSLLFYVSLVELVWIITINPSEAEASGSQRIKC
ncbi:hypothetical protein RJT34_18546 [Clitoria ternatea]|uniref:Uncharacterized protein n=1 Tax=Clitoria ternatea TaxID=43366 RepID=A0AAN9JB03_CLITE